MLHHAVDGKFNRTDEGLNESRERIFINLCVLASILAVVSGDQYDKWIFSHVSVGC